ncbi:ABC transporter ATP-binding protein [Amycolatopsis sp. GM8]|uniref:ABC transporter ATP-binding protein n=1 Tax=Amycolatopsis sp. GM8 TaxID=2896530 RepID=UPI001F22E328|nr:ABC transporter ATP-binding protein [Amycolatopsis sp. GM8]
MPDTSGDSSEPEHQSRREVLNVRDLSVRTDSGLQLLDNVSFTLGEGERVGLIGESGSGKSLTALSIMALLPDGVQAGGSVQLRRPGRGDDVAKEMVGGRERELSQVRGKDVAMVFQEPMTALNPTMRVGKQVSESMLIHGTRPDRRSAYAAAVALLDAVGIPNPAEAARAYPHHFSGGQRQRIVLALALANDPALLVCDEPTTALDVTVQARVVNLILRGVQERNSALLFVTHDLALVASICERVIVMYGGRIVETGPVRDVFTRPQHRYTQGLVGASDVRKTDERGRLTTIPGTVPPAGRFPDGCVFRNRCSHATASCSQTPEWTPTGDGKGHACFHPVGEGHPTAERGA